MTYARKMRRSASAELTRLQGRRLACLRCPRDTGPLSRGTLLPHTEEWKRVGESARYVVRSLVEDWVR